MTPTPTATAANVKKADSSHWYYTDGRPCYELPKKDGSGMKVPTLADARKLNLVPSVTTILNVLHKQALVEWLIEQAVLAVVTTPRLPGEADDAFIERVLRTERVQDEESVRARDRGTQIHDALEAYMLGQPVSDDIKPWIMPAAEAIAGMGNAALVEGCLVGNGYAGRADLIQDGPGYWRLWDWKSTKKLPDPKKGGAWDEHRLQGAAYAKAWDADKRNTKPRAIIVGNVYISTVDCGKFSICEHEEWQDAYHEGFLPLVQHWQWVKGYTPQQ